MVVLKVLMAVLMSALANTPWPSADKVPQARSERLQAGLLTRF
jgi:hypothetical protein